MAASIVDVKFADGRSMSMYLPTAHTVNGYCPVSFSHEALIGDGVSFTPTKPITIRRMTAIAGVTGKLIVEEQGNDIPYVVNLANHLITLNRPGGDDLNIPLKANKEYKFKVLVQLSA